MQPEPDFRSERNEGEGVLELERPTDGFVAEEIHAQQTTGPTAQRTEQNQGHLRNPLAGTTGAPFIKTEREQRHGIEYGEPENGDGISKVQTRVSAIIFGRSHDCEEKRSYARRRVVVFGKEFAGRLEHTFSNGEPQGLPVIHAGDQLRSAGKIIE